MPSSLPRWIVALLSLAWISSSWADGFSLAWSLKNEPHVVLELTPDQVATVGRERKLVLTDAQRATLKQRVKKVPKVLGVESPGEPDCGCCIAPAFWSATNQMIIWTRRLAADKDGGRHYHELRLKPGRYTADAQGQIYAAGQPVTWKQFEAAVRAKQEGEYLQLSMPPEEPRDFAARVERLKKRKHFFFRL